ncbi:pentatricopeptide repeat-containing protein, partial [Tanacetum coccineum]
MIVKNMISDSVLYSLFVYGKIKMGEVEYAREVYDEMVKSGFEANWFVHTKFIKAYCEGQKIEDGDELFKDMERSRFVLSCLAFNEVVERLNGRESVPCANEMLTVLLDKGFVTDVNTFSYLIAGYRREGDVEGVFKLYFEIEYRKLSHASERILRLSTAAKSYRVQGGNDGGGGILRGGDGGGRGVWRDKWGPLVAASGKCGGLEVEVDLQTTARPVISKEYSLEYRIDKIEMHVGAVQEKSDKIEMHVGAVQEGEHALVIDNLIVTGGTLCAAINLLERVGDKVVEYACVIELPKLKIILISSEKIEEVMAVIQTKTTMKKFKTNDKANYYSGITSIMVNGKRAYKLKGKFFDVLRDNAFSGTNGEDMVEHIEYFLKIVDPINLPNVNYERLRLSVFPISLAGNASKWFDEFKVSISLIHIEYCESPTAELFDVDSGRISIVTVNTKKYHFDVL